VSDISGYFVGHNVDLSDKSGFLVGHIWICRTYLAILSDIFGVRQIWLCRTHWTVTGLTSNALDKSDLLILLTKMLRCNINVVSSLRSLLTVTFH